MSVSCLLHRLKTLHTRVGTGAPCAHLVFLASVNSEQLSQEGRMANLFLRVLAVGTLDGSCTEAWIMVKSCVEGLVWPRRVAPRLWYELALDAA